VVAARGYGHPVTRELPAAARTWWSTPGPMTTLGAHRIELPLGADGRPAIADVVRTVQGLLVYDIVSEPFYGVALTPERADDIHVRPVAELLDRAVAIDPAALTEARPPDRRVTGRCHTFAKLTVAILRAHGVPARARCGFDAAFRRGWFEDHWVAEYWRDDDFRWVRVDAQLDDAWIRALGFTADPLDLTRAEFLTAGEAWQAWRAGDLDADRCGLSSVHEHGAFWIAGNLRLDTAALLKTEMLPWDVWGPGWGPDQPVPDDLEVWDALAAVTADPDRQIDELRAAVEESGIAVPTTVFNHLRGVEERW
jgi:hypothetical protein